MKEMITRKENCCGCGACAQICPKKCITMAADEEGFLYPRVDGNACIQCGLCRQVCPALRELPENSAEPEIFAAYAKNEEIRKESSSGGIFSLLAGWILDQGGAVFGAAFDDDFSVHHLKIERVEDLSKLRGSKYVQSRIENTYSEAETLLKAGRKVLFSGVGCQIAGLKAFLRTDYENLYTVDVLCHGVPSLLVWERYLREQEKRHGAQIRRVSFRNKDSGWKTYSEEQIFENGSRYFRRASKDVYMNLFLQDICLRPSCHVCAFRKGKSGSDLTLGDAWGIDRWMPDMDDDKGTSIVLINSDKGQNLWEQIGELACARQGDPESILRHNCAYYKPAKCHPNRTRFFLALNSGASMVQLAHLARKPLHRRILSFGKRVLKSLLKKMGIL